MDHYYLSPCKLHVKMLSILTVRIVLQMQRAEVRYAPRSEARSGRGPTCNCGKTFACSGETAALRYFRLYERERSQRS